MNNDIMLKAETFLNKQNIKYKKPGIIHKISDDEVEVVFKHPLCDDPNYIICPDEYRVVVNLKTNIARWGFQM